MSAKASYRQAARDIDLLCGVSVSAKTQERIVNRTPIDAPEITEPVAEVDLDGGMVRLVGDPGQPSEWKQYKAVRVNGDGPGMAWFQDNSALLDWLHHLTFVSLFYCLGDGHAGIWSLFAQFDVPQIAEEILDWYHLIENWRANSPHKNPSHQRWGTHYCPAIFNPSPHPTIQTLFGEVASLRTRW